MNAATRPLNPAQLCVRLLATVGIGAALLGVRSINPETVSWWPLQTSCGAFTGLPCIFCGTTRAMHHLLQGNFAQALYFNWIAYPVAALAAAILLVVTAELLTERRLFVRRLTFRVTPPTLAWTGAALAALWILQVTLAVSFGKGELLNPAGPLYAFFVK